MIFALNAVTIVSALAISNTNGGHYVKRDIGVTSDQPDTSSPYDLVSEFGIFLIFIN
jgi:hypothetical protein